MITIYTPEVKLTRLSYAATHLFNHILGSEFRITSDREEYLSSQSPCINYSEEEFNHGLHIIPYGLVFEQGLREREEEELAVSSWNGFLTLFSSDKGDIPFDVFSATFYLLTLYEELYPKKLDQHGRFSPAESLLYRHKSLDVPVVDRWAYLLKKEWEKRGDDTSGFKLRKFKLINTFDIDNPYRYRNRGVVRAMGGIAKDLLKLRFDRIVDRTASGLHLKEDPYYAALMYIDKFHRQQNRPYHLFILMGEESKYDRSTLITPFQYYHYLKQLKDVNIGLHPSYNTHRNMKLLTKERAELEEVLGYRLYTTRQHFLRMQSPETFEELALAGFTDDYTLAFAHVCGFRSGTAIPYKFYDLRRDQVSDLTIHPTVMMDSTLIFHQKMKADRGIKRIKHLIDQCKESGGDYLCLWHNSNLAGSKKSNPWINAFVETTTYGISLEND
jgi:hypothetical protein